MTVRWGRGYNDPRPPMLIDLHVHTSHGSGDSNLGPEELVAEATRIGLEGVCLTEHNRTWEVAELGQFAQEHNHLLLVRAIEVETNMGHITVFGLDRYVSGIWDIAELRRVSDEAGAFMVVAHPFRRLLGLRGSSDNLLFKGIEHPPTTAEEAAGHPIFQYVDAIEANGADSDQESELAVEVARHLGRPAVGGSDVHSVSGLGACVTVFPRPIESEGGFMEALRAGGYYPAVGLRTGTLRPVGAIPR